MFRPDDRAEAVGAWSGLGGVASAIGPVLGGVLVGLAPWGWRLAFLINLPLAVAGRAGRRARTCRRRATSEATGRLDVVGAASAALGLALVIYALTEGPRPGLAARRWSSPGARRLAVLAGFLVNEAHVRDPMMPLSLFRNRQFAGANLVTLVVYAALAGALFLLPVALQRVSGFSPVQAGSALLPVTVVMLLLSARMGRLAQRIGPRRPMTIGPIVAACGMALLARIGASSELPHRRAAGGAGLRGRAVDDGRAADRDRAGRRAAARRSAWRRR